MDVELVGWNCDGLFCCLILFLIFILIICERLWMWNFEDEICEGN